MRVTTTCRVSIINTSYQSLPFGSGDDPEKLFIHQSLNHFCFFIRQGIIPCRVCWYLAKRHWLPWLRVSKRCVRFGPGCSEMSGAKDSKGSPVVRMARGKICFGLPSCRQEAVRARQKAVRANLNSRDLMYRLGPAPKRATRPI